MCTVEFYGQFTRQYKYFRSMIYSEGLNAGLEILSAVVMKSSVFCDIMACSQL
jgi:hypothetical protein